MKKSEFRSLIREEIKKTLNEGIFSKTTSVNPDFMRKYKIELSFQPTYIGYTWTVNGKENYEETSYDDIKTFDHLLKKVSSEIAYQTKMGYTK